MSTNPALNTPFHPPQSRGIPFTKGAALPTLYGRTRQEPGESRPRHTFNKQLLAHLTPADRRLFESFGQGMMTDVPTQIMHHAFEAHAAADPAAIAARHLDESITYGELDRQANRLAAILGGHGVTSGDHVALFLQRSIPMLVGMVAALKGGAAYVPQHVGVAPEAHLRYVMASAETRIILTLSHLKHLIPVPDGAICLAIDELMQEPFADEHAFTIPFKPAIPISPTNTCFIIFTSGTTGNPNGVQVTHGNVSNIVLTKPGNLGMRPGLKVAQILSIAFDMSAWETLGCLSNGATLIIRGKDFMQAVKQADIVIATPSVLGSLDAEQCRHIKVAAVAGEPCPRPLADKWSSFCTFYNACGPTETTIVNTMQRYDGYAKGLTIGKPTPNNTVYILNEKMQACAIGEVGEMWAGGQCVSVGYIGNEELTRQRYQPDPFLGEGRMMFRTRDLGRWTEDGELEHFGRTDDQVKIRGFRVELDSVSAVMESVPDCTHAVTLKFDSRTLVAFVTPPAVDMEQVRAAVAKELPYYCMPELIIGMPELPMTSRGKVDKRALLQIAIEQHANIQAQTMQMETVTC